MATGTNFPASLDSFNNKVDGVDDILSVETNTQSSAIEQLQLKVGITNSADPSSHEYNINNLLNTTVNNQVLTADDTQPSGFKWAANPAGFADPMTTRGDIIYRDSTNNTTRLPLGSNNKVLKSDGTDLIWGDGASGGVGIEIMNLFNQVGKIRNSYLNTLNRGIISEPFTTNAFVKNYRIDNATGGTKTLVLNSTDVANYGKPKAGETYRLVETGTGNVEDIVVDSFDTVTITTVSNLTYTYDASDYCYSESGLRNSDQTFGYNGTTGIQGKQVVYRGQLRDVGAKTNASIDGEIVYNTDFQFTVQTVNVGAKTLTLTTNFDNSTYISNTSPYDKVFLQKVMINANGEVTPLNDGREYTVTSSSYGSPTLTVGLADSYQDFDSGTTETDGLTDISAPSADGNEYWICARKAIVPKYSFVASGADESYQVPTIKRIGVLNTAIAYPSYVHSHWKLNEPSGKAINSKAGATYDLTQVGTVPTATGKLGLARGPFTTSNYFQWSAGGSNATVYDTKIFIVEGFFKTSVTGANQNIIRKHNAATAGWLIQISSANKLNFQIANTPMSSPSNYTDGLWHHFLCGQLSTSGAVNDNRMYIDGSLVAQQNSFTWTAAVNDLSVGCLLSTEPFQGLLDSLAYWNVTPVSLDWATVEAIIAQRINGGRGREYGYNYGIHVITQETGKAGQLYRPQIELVRNNTSSVDSIDSAGYIISGS